LWVLGDEVEKSLPVDLEFAPWHEEELIGHPGNRTDEYHGWTDGSRRVSAAFGWSLRGYNDQGKEVELECNKGCLGEFETAFDGEMDSIADIMEYAIDNQIPGDLTIHSDAQAAISRAQRRSDVGFEKEDWRRMLSQEPNCPLVNQLVPSWVYNCFRGRRQVANKNKRET
jgi:hypothetical protein